MSMSSLELTCLLLLTLACAGRGASPRAAPPLVEEVAGVLETSHYAHPPRARVLEAWRALPGDATVQALLAATVDRATRLLSAEETRALMADLQEQDGTGLGLPELLSVDLDERSGALTVVTPVPDSPAARAGLRPGDVLLDIDAVATGGLSLSAAMARLRGAPGSSVQLGVRTRGGAQRSVRLIRERPAAAPSVALRVLAREGGPVGYLRLSRFVQATPAELALALQALQTRGVERAVLDLRDNPGGAVDALTACAGLLAGPLLVANLPGAPSDSATLTSPDAARYAGALVVLVNEGTASAAELLAGALQAKRRGLLVGTRTFGKGLVHLPFPLSNGDTLLVSIARAHTPSGRDILAEALSPERTVATPERPWSLFPPQDDAAVPDAQLQAALALLP